MAVPLTGRIVSKEELAEAQLQAAEEQRESVIEGVQAQTPVDQARTEMTAEEAARILRSPKVNQPETAMAVLALEAATADQNVEDLEYILETLGFDTYGRLREFLRMAAERAAMALLEVLILDVVEMHDLFEQAAQVSGLRQAGLHTRADQMARDVLDFQFSSAGFKALERLIRQDRLPESTLDLLYEGGWIWKDLREQALKEHDAAREFLGLLTAKPDPVKKSYFVRPTKRVGKTERDRHNRDQRPQGKLRSDRDREACRGGKSAKGRTNR